MARPAMTPDQLQWVVDHNQQIRAGHRVQILDAVDAWRADRARLRELLEHQRKVAQFCRRLDARIVQTPKEP